jgi:hypothetical protein
MRDDGEVVGEWADSPSATAPGATSAPAPAALPVELALDETRFTGLRRFVEGDLGWQAIDPDAGRLVPPRVLLQDLDSALTADTPSPDTTQAERRGGHIPRVVLLGPDDDVRRSASALVGLQADAVVIWPDDRDRLATVIAGLLARPTSAAPRAALRIGGSGGGVGTTTVALTAAGLAAWAGVPTLAGVRGTGLRAPVVPSAALAGTGVWRRAEQLAGIPLARAVRLVDHDPVPDPADPDVELFVLDAGVDPEVDVLVCRRDAAALQMLSVTTAGMIVVVGDGPASTRALRRAAAGRPGIVLPHSARVARAGLLGRVPAGLPGAFVERLRDVLPEHVRSGERPDHRRERALGADPGG